MSPLKPLEPSLLPQGIRSRFVEGICGLRMHVLEAGHESAGQPLVLLLHGFPELAYSWRKVVPQLAAAGFHVVAPDQRGYGRTTGWSDAYDQDLRPFSMLPLVRDALALVFALGHRSVAAVVGHDFGSPVAAWAALVRPDVFRSVVLMSAPFAGPPALIASNATSRDTIEEDLARLPRPRKHYQRYYATRAANTDMWHCPEGVHRFLRAYFHYKSADWRENRPRRLKEWSAEELAQMPTYYIMDLDRTMPETVAPFLPRDDQIAACRWLPDAELAVYAREFERTGFQGGLNWYRARLEPALDAELALFDGRTIDVPCMFLAGRSDWGVFQVPGAFERMQTQVCTRMDGCHLIEGAGHWVMQEKAEETGKLIAAFCRKHRAG
jgi:pimeloyl-ACP methyl ester carboxylesterase